jgi:hypothetical protein
MQVAISMRAITNEFDCPTNGQTEKKCWNWFPRVTSVTCVMLEIKINKIQICRYWQSVASFFPISKTKKK